MELKENQKLFCKRAYRVPNKALYGHYCLAGDVVEVKKVNIFSVVIYNTLNKMRFTCSKNLMNYYFKEQERF